ncbi:hypothetical protein HY989_03215 [Candidatus Micrarchaeota archaeon]|nr:hypothetical protein [Candidatus Micrarchaeota archaeon]
MEISFKEQAKEDLKAMDSQTRDLFISHAEKISKIPPRRHMRLGLPVNVENVTKQARLIYQMGESVLYIIRCFETHKEYERWHKSFK